MLRRKITATARSHLRWIESSYGMGENIDEWCRKIVAKADSRNRPPTEVSLADVLGELEELACYPESDWELSARRFKEAGWLERLGMLQALVRKWTPPVRMRVNTKEFRGFSDKKLRVEVKAVYEINLGAGIVRFLAFDSYTPDNTEDAVDTASDQSTDW